MGEMPQRIQLKRTKGWRMPPNTVKVDRSTRWGNPFVLVAQPGHKWVKRAWSVEVDGETIHRDLPRDEALNWSLMRFAAEVAALLDLTPLQGKNLACWCDPGEPCHADVLLGMANEATPHQDQEASNG